MPDLAFTLTKDLVAALTEITGDEATEASPVVVLAAYIDALAKEYGLSESLSLDVDPVERSHQVGPVKEIVHHYFEAGESDLDADAIRSRLYELILVLAGDPGVRKVLNRNQPLTESKVLHLAQIYLNLEVTSERHRLPIAGADGRDIPVPGASADFATMTWTARVNQKGSYKSSGQSFRTQGARLVVLMAQHLASQTPPPPNSPAGELDVRPTRDPEKPMEITLKDLVERAWKQGEYDDAADLSASHLRIVKRRAETSPFEAEPDLAAAYLLKGFVSLRPVTDWARGNLFDAGMDTIDDLERAVASYSVLSDLNPQNDEHSEELANAYLALCISYETSERLEDSVEAAHEALSIRERLAAAQPTNVERQQSLRTALMGLSIQLRGMDRRDDSLAAMARAVTVAEGLVASESSEPEHHEMLIVALWGLSQDLRDVGRFDEALEPATRAVGIADSLDAAQPENRKRLASSLHGLSGALKDAGHLDDAVSAARRSVAVREALVASDPESTDSRLSLALMMFALGRLLREINRVEEVPAAAGRAAEIFRQLAAAEPEKVEYRAGLWTSLSDLSDALYELGQYDESLAVDEELEGLGNE